MKASLRKNFRSSVDETSEKLTAVATLESNDREVLEVCSKEQGPDAPGQVVKEPEMSELFLMSCRCSDFKRWRRRRRFKEEDEAQHIFYRSRAP